MDKACAPRRDEQHPFIIHAKGADLMTEQEKQRIAYLRQLLDQARDEIQKRIEQRDKYAIQLVIALTAVLTVAFSEFGGRMVILAAPLPTIFFTRLTLYSYRIHRARAEYIADVLESEIAGAVGDTVRAGWEGHYRSLGLRPGHRDHFFVTAMWMVWLASVFTTAEAAFVEGWIGIMAVVSFIYFIACVLVTGALRA